MAEPSPSAENTPEEEKVETISFGLWWPAGDPEKLRAAATAWEAMANHLDTTTTTLAGAAAAVTQANTATAISAFADHWQRTGGPGGALPTIAGYCRDMATALREFADEIDDAREKILQLAAEIVASVAIGVGLAFFTAGISAAAVTATTARIIGLAAQIGVNVGLRAATIISRVAVMGAAGSVESMAANTIVQVGRNAAFNDNHNPLDGFNLGEVATSGALGFAAGGTLGGALAVRAMRPPRLKVDDSQFGSKVGKHARDYGLDPANPADRAWIKEHIDDITRNSEEVRQGPWNPQGGGDPDNFFFRKGNDVIVTKRDGTFVTILKDGASNGWFKGAHRR